MSDTLQFIVMVDGEVSDAALLQSVLGAFPDAVRLKAHSCDVRGNWLEIWPEKDADARLALDDEDGFLYYRWRVELTPTAKSVGEDDQVALARALVAAFEGAGGRARVLANFEHRV